jgi:hypothetical protein
MNLDIWKVISKPANSRPCYQLTVIQLNSLEIMAAHQVVKAEVGDERAVVEL